MMRARVRTDVLREAQPSDNDIIPTSSSSPSTRLIDSEKATPGGGLARRKGRMSIVALAFVATYVLLLAPPTSVQTLKKNVGGSSGAVGIVDGSSSSIQPINGTSSSDNYHRYRHQPIRIFYNLFVQTADDATRVLGIFDEQFRAINPELHDVMNISINSIGYKLPQIPPRYLKEHHEDGGEDRTLHTLWEYCRADENRDAKVVYLHSKGSFHPHENNDRLRRFLTEGALSRECADLPEGCDVCSSRMSPHPHPHTSGNMWLARCSYIAKLRDPYDLREGRLPEVFNADNGCQGYGRYFVEHWVYSHPAVRPCDLYPGDEYTWAYEDVPDMGFAKEIDAAPRFGFDVFLRLLLKSYWYCREDKSMNSRRGYLENRKVDYKQLYGFDMKDLNESYYLWKFLNLSGSS